MPELYEDLERARGEQERHKENAARLAQAYAEFDTTGQGSIEFEERVNFGLTFIEKPIVVYGSELDLEALDDLLENDSEVNDVPALPLCSGYVTEWDRDDRGFYKGCWIAARIFFPSSPAVPTDTAVVITHHFTFAAVAMKDVPYEG
jgi:hypothetical protein